ncbi:hypothetical protein [Helicobacter sp.]|uniref:hypothetical protein n=1 Tax=Helicobacter sp. TaxID=218 RepID=UPI0025B8EA52|nr:hypothetical protein [Helicobacter sp.]MCI5968364.1 hypothetical protein [Helicobacter sp.]MDY2584827.1 hypothetical protein [Helicobacter sp.]
MQNLENIELLESCNFNPLEKSPAFLKTRLGVAVSCFVFGIMLGLLIVGVLAFLELLEQRKSQVLNAQINALQNELQMLGKSRSQAQDTLINLQEKLQNLQAVYQANLESLKSFGKADFQVAQFFRVLYPHLENFDVKIAYFGLEKESVTLLLIGKNALKILEAIEKQSLGKVRVMREYGAFLWSEIQWEIQRLETYKWEIKGWEVER